MTEQNKRIDFTKIKQHAQQAKVSAIDRDKPSATINKTVIAAAVLSLVVGCGGGIFFMNSQVKSEDSNGLGEFQYESSVQNVFTEDINGDGLSDIVLKILNCEKEQCHISTRSYSMDIFLNKGNTYQHAVSESLGGFSVEITSIKNGIIKVESLDYADSDPTCCPSLISSKSYKLSNDKLMQVGN